MRVCMRACSNGTHLRVVASPKEDKLGVLNLSEPRGHGAHLRVWYACMRACVQRVQRVHACMRARVHVCVHVCMCACVRACVAKTTRELDELQGEGAYGRLRRVESSLDCVP